MTFSTIIDTFISKLKESVLKILTLTMNKKSNIHLFIDESFKGVEVIFSDLFIDSQKLSAEQIKSRLAKLVSSYDVPLKYTKDVLASIQDVSIFTGFYDKAYADVFTKREIMNLKKVILTGKYSGKTESEIASDILNTINVTKQRAQLLARTEIQRLQETTNLIYYKLPKINSLYDRVWFTKHDGKVRPSHQAMDGKIADPKTGQFYSDDAGLVNGPGSGPTPFAIGCRCYTKLILKKPK